MSFQTLDLNLLRVFDAVMSEQNLTRAAMRLSMTQPAVSNALRRLREALGDDLLVRNAHGVTPTSRAEELWPAVRLALTALEEAITPQTFDLSEMHATFRFAMADSTAALVLPSLMLEIKRHAPHLCIRLVPLMTRDPKPLLLQGEIDLAVGYFPGIAAQISGGQGAFSAILHQRLYSGSYVCIMRCGHPLAESEFTLDDYCRAEHVLMSVSGKAHGIVDDVLNRFGRERHIALTVNQFFTVAKVVAYSDLLAVVPRNLIAAIGLTDLVISREIPFDLPPVHVDMLWHERYARDPAHRWIRDMLYDITGGTRIHHRQLSEEIQLTEERKMRVRATSHK